MNTFEARRALYKLSVDTVHIPETVGPRNELLKFINEVEDLLKNNSIKQTPALFKEKK